MKTYDERLPLIDAAIDKHNGEWPDEKCDFLSMAGRANAIYKQGDILPTLGGDGDDKDGFWYTVCTRQEFEQRIAERQNKPSWADAPEWAEWLAQNMLGVWWWYPKQESKQSLASICFINTNEKCPTAAATSGEVIGKWQHTLEKRPETKEQDMNNDWHKKGDYPPEGERVEFFENGKWIECTYKSLDPKRFRPIQAETEKLVERALSDVENITCLASINTVQALIEQGYRKTKPMTEDEFTTHSRKQLTEQFSPMQLATLYRAGARFLDNGEKS